MHASAAYFVQSRSSGKTSAIEWACAKPKSSARSASCLCGLLSLLLSFLSSWDHVCGCCSARCPTIPILAIESASPLRSSFLLPRRIAMAGATKISIRTVAALAVVGAGFGASKVNLKSLVLNTVTGPGNISRIIAFIIVLANLKNLPFVWHVCTSYALFNYYKPIEESANCSLDPCSWVRRKSEN